MLKNLVKRIAGLFTGLAGKADAADVGTDNIIQPPVLPEDDLQLDELCQNFSRELFAQMLIELPAQRKIMADAFAQGNDRRLRDSVHQLLGAAAYCDAPELEAGLRELRLALKTGNHATVEFYYTRAINVIDSTLRFSGYRAT